ncbi:hypothetical protein E2542_SST20540 [Spatholobus suberectus]|nr:hypothetical protein E2542_SST20540 [Spatholobus suberectus]
MLVFSESYVSQLFKGDNGSDDADNGGGGNNGDGGGDDGDGGEGSHNNGGGNTNDSGGSDGDDGGNDNNNGGIGLLSNKASIASLFWSDGKMNDNRHASLVT